MKQRIKIRRIEEQSLQIETLQALTSETLTALVNDPLRGAGSPGFARPEIHTVSDWNVVKAEPECCPTTTRPGQKPKRSHSR